MLAWEAVTNTNGDQKTGFALTRRTVRRALGSRAWTEALILAFAPVFALLAFVTPAAEQGMRWLWLALSIAASLVSMFSHIEQRRRVSFVLELCQARRELAMGSFVYDGAALQRDTPLRYFPIHASLLFVKLRSATCPSSHERPAAQALAVTVNVLLGWWSLSGLVTTPFYLWRCLRGGDAITPAELIDAVDEYVEAQGARPQQVSIKVVLLVASAMALLIALALLLVRFTV